MKLNYLDGSGSERTGVAVSTGIDHAIISIAPEANGAASLDLENNDLTGVETVVPSPDNHGQMELDGLLALTPQSQPAVPASVGVLYVDAADGALKFMAAPARSPPSLPRNPGAGRSFAGAGPMSLTPRSAGAQVADASMSRAERPVQEPLEVDYDPWGPGGRQPQSGQVPGLSRPVAHAVRRGPTASWRIRPHALTLAAWGGRPPEQRLRQIGRIFL